MGSRRGCISQVRLQMAYQGTGLWNPVGRSSPTSRSFYVCHFQGNYKENERVGQASHLRPQFPPPYPIGPNFIHFRLFEVLIEPPEQNDAQLQWLALLLVQEHE